MKKNILIFILALIASNLVAQITVTNVSFPAVGDTLRTAVDADPSINLQSPGEDITWNFTFLDGPAFESIILDPNEGAATDEFPNATLMTGQLGISEVYYSTSATEYKNLGFSGEDPFFGLAFISKSNPPLVEQTAPLNYGDVNNSISSAFVPYAWDDLPTQLTDSLGGGFLISPDSIAFELEVDRTEEVDAWGRVFIPGGNFEVLRVRRWEVTDTKVKAYLPFFNWTDVTDAIAGIIPAQQGGLLGKDTMLTFLYYSNDAKEPIAVIRANPITEAPTNARYKSIDITTGIIKLHEKKPNIYAYPNPAIEDIRFDLVNIPNGKYDLRIYNILGVEVWSQQYQLQNTNDTIMLNVSDFRKGAYLYSLINEKGKKIATRRLVILRP